MFGKKTIITLIVLGIGLLVYLLFFSGGDDGGKSGGGSFFGSGGSSSSVKYINTQGKDGNNTQGKDTVTTINGKDGSGNSTQNITNTNNNTTNQKDGQKTISAGNSSFNYSYTIEGDVIQDNSYSRDTTFNIDGTTRQPGDSNLNNAPGNGAGNAGLRGLSSRRLTDDELEKSDIYQKCITIVEPLLSANFNVSQIQSELQKISGFNLLPTAQQTAFANDIVSKKYGNNASKYCLEITQAILDVFGDLAIYQECIQIVAPLLQQSPTKTDIKGELLKLTGFSLLKQAEQDRFINQIFTKEFGTNPQVYCINITSAILDAMQGLAIYKMCVSIVTPLINGNPSASEVKTALLKLPGFTMIEVQDQNKFINDIVTKKYGDNPNRYCVDIVSAILEALDPAALYQNCLIALKEVVKERELLNGTIVPEETILLKLSLMGIFNGLNTFEERKATAQQFFGEEYDRIIADIQALTTQNYDANAPKICLKIVGLITGVLTGEDTFAECVQLLTSAKVNSPQKTALVDILPNFETLLQDVKNNLQNMFASYLGTGTPTPEEICAIFTSEQNGEGLDGVGTSSDEGGESENTTSDSVAPNISGETATACSNLVRNIKQEYEMYSTVSYSDPVPTLISKVPEYEFFIPAAVYPTVIDKTFVAYLSLPRTTVSGTQSHRDDNSKAMTYNNQSYFTNLSSHEKGQISKRLLEVYKLINSSPSYSTTITDGTIKEEILPYICKNAHPECDDIKWNNAVSMYLNYKKNANASYAMPNDIFEKAAFLNSNPFYNKCLNNSALTLTSEDDTLPKIRAKVEANLPEIKSTTPDGGGVFTSSTPAGQLSSLKLSDQEFAGFQCYVERCTAGGRCSIVCENEIRNFCTNVATKYFASVPNVAVATSPEQIFFCPKNQGNEFNMIKLHCLEISEKYNTNEIFREQLQAGCVNGVSRALTKNKANTSGISKNQIQAEFANTTCQNPNGENISCSENEAFISLTPSQQNDIIDVLHGKIINGNLQYEHLVEQSCYDADSETLKNQANHIDQGLQYFLIDARSVRSNIVTRLWADNVSKMANTNRSVTQQECLQTAKEEWEKFMSSPLLLEEKQSKLTLPPSSRCKCYLDSIYSLLHERITQDDQECALIASDIKAIASTIITQSENTARSAPSIIGKTLTTIPRFKSLESADQATIRSGVESDLSANRQSARQDLLDRQIFLTHEQKTLHCNTIDQKLTFASAELTACHAVLTKVNYEMATQKTVKSNNVLCTIVGNTIKDFASDTGQVNVFSTTDSQYNDIRQSTCTQKLRAIYLQIYGLKQTFWEGGENWTFPRTTAEEARPQCANVPDEYGNINYDAFVET